MTRHLTPQPVRQPAQLAIADLPYLVIKVDVTDITAPTRIADTLASGAYGGAYMLLTDGPHPIGQTVLGGLRGLSASSISRSITDALPHLPYNRPPSTVERAAPPAAVGRICAVICTYGPATGLQRCIESLIRQTDPRFTVLIVDNAPNDKTRIPGLLAKYRGGPLAIDYVCEPIQGLSRARNRAIRESTADWLAFIDDDEEADESWMAQMHSALSSQPSSAVVVGAMLPAHLSTAPALLFEAYGGHNKGRPYTRALHTKHDLRSRIFYPLPAFGTGGNMAIRRDIAAALGYFDVNLGAGTICPGAEDTLFFSEALDAGYTLLYDPAIVTWHHHRSTSDDLARQIRNYALGLGGYYAALLLNRPHRIARLLPLLPIALHDFYAPHSLRNGTPIETTSHLRRGSRTAVLLGALRYARARVRAQAQPAIPPPLVPPTPQPSSSGAAAP